MYAFYNIAQNQENMRKEKTERIV